MANIGSAFLGDLQAQRIRQLASPTSSPPSSPPAPHTSFAQALSVPPPITSAPELLPPPPPTNKVKIDPELALELRVRWLEALVHGSDPSRKRKETIGTLARLTEEVKKRLDAIVEPNDSLKKFIDTYDQHAQYLAPTFALSGILGLEEEESSVYGNMTPQELEAYLIELEPDIRAADGDMREIEALVNRGVTGAGKLGDYEALKPRLARLIAAHEADMRAAGELERRVARLVEEHVTCVDGLSELFVAWDESVLGAEAAASRLEKDAAGRERRGL